MEKINTPLMAHMEFIDSAISGLNKLKLSHKKGSNGFREIEGKIWSLEAIKKNAESLLPTEREVIEKAFTQGATEMDHLHNDREESFSHAQDYFTETFKSYE